MSKSYSRFYVKFIFGSISNIAPLFVSEPHFVFLIHVTVDINKVLSFFFFLDKHLLKFRCAEHCWGCFFLPFVYLAFILLGPHSPFFFRGTWLICALNLPDHIWVHHEKQKGRGGVVLHIISVLTLSILQFLGSNRSSWPLACSLSTDVRPQASPLERSHLL